MGVVGPQGQMMRNQQPGQRGMPQPGMPMQNQQQHMLEHEENLSDKELYPGQHGQMVSKSCQFVCIYFFAQQFLLYWFLGCLKLGRLALACLVLLLLLPNKKYLLLTTHITVLYILFIR